jgi:hypothetical protein
MPVSQYIAFAYHIVSSGYRIGMQSEEMLHKNLTLIREPLLKGEA